MTEKKQPSPVRLFKLDDIPNVMQSKGWRIAAAMMRRWFNSPARTMSNEVKRGNVKATSLNTAEVDESIATMAWALGFHRVNTAYQDLLQNWASAAGKARLRDMILASQPPSPKITSWRFGDLSKTVREIDANFQVNICKVGQMSDPMDDFYGAMGKALLKLAVSGVVTRTSSGFHIDVDELGVYLRDTYDFNDDSFYSQPLGYWGYRGVERGFSLHWDVEIDTVYVEADINDVHNRMYEVQNDDFREFRKKYARGGDFVVFSDIKRVSLARSISLNL